MNFDLLAEAAVAEPMISGAWVIAAITAVIAAMFAGFKGGVVKRQRMTLEEPVPEIPTRKVFTPPSWDAHRALCDRVSRMEESFVELRRDQASQYREMMQATNGIQTLLGEKLDGIARGIHSRIDEIYKPKTPR